MRPSAERGSSIGGGLKGWNSSKVTNSLVCTCCTPPPYFLIQSFSPSSHWAAGKVTRVQLYLHDFTRACQSWFRLQFQRHLCRFLHRCHCESHLKMQKVVQKLFWKIGALHSFRTVPLLPIWHVKLYQCEPGLNQRLKAVHTTRKLEGENSQDELSADFQIVRCFWQQISL